MNSTDVVVIGGGPAGLSAALHLARLARSVVLLDSGGGRSSFGQVNRNYLGFVEGVSTRELRDLGRRQLGAYAHVHCVDALATSLEAGDAQVVVRTDGDSFPARAVLLATGVEDDYPHFPGWADCVGRSMFWCLTCDGWEARGQRVAVVGGGDTAAVEALRLRLLTDDVTLVLDPGGSLSEERRAQLSDAGLPVRQGPLREVDHDRGMLRSLTTEAGEVVCVDKLFSVRPARPLTDLARQAGLRLTDSGWVEVDSEQATSHPRVFAAGDVTALHAHSVPAAVHEGAQAAAAVHHSLYPPELRAG